MEHEENPDSALRRLEDRLERASDRAESLFAEAAARARAAGRPPAAGWQAPEDAEPPRGDTDLLLSLVESLRELIPPELQRRLAEALRELLLALRALIDWYIERLERRRRQPVEVEDIPIT